MIGGNLKTKKIFIIISMFIIFILASYFIYSAKKARSQEEPQGEVIPPGQKKIEVTEEKPWVEDQVEVNYDVHWLPEEQVDAMNAEEEGP